VGCAHRCNRTGFGHGGHSPPYGIHRKAIVMARSKRQVVEEVEYEKQPWNIYSMMLLLSMVAIIIGCIFLTLELKAYDWKLDAKVSADHLANDVSTVVGPFANDATA
jgi:hypothetical protein